MVCLLLRYNNILKGIAMYSVTQRISAIKQPRGGYINPRSLSVKTLEDLGSLHDSKGENISPILVGIAVDYMTRFACGTPAKEAFCISFLGAALVGETTNAESLADKICGLDDASIIAACKLAGYDSAFRAGLQAYRPVSGISPNSATVENIREMVKRGYRFFEEYGPVTHDGITFEGGYTFMVSTGDGDFTTADTLWDFKVSVKPPTSKHTLQVCMYWLLGLHSIHADIYRAIDKLGFFNPRLGTVYTISVSDIPDEVLHEIEMDVICYEEDEALF